MKNKYVLMGGGFICLAIWFILGENTVLANMGNLDDDYWMGALIAIALGAGSTGGDDLLSILVEGIKGYVPTMILLAVGSIVGTVSYLLITGAMAGAIGMDINRIIMNVGQLVVSATMANLMFSYMKKANA
ncbi:MAG: hypothetical protein HOL12_03485 [Kordiimonadaceae bacterium]|jgi:hypothetical protein|nr:hypothetical protein [Kordiimonadaceae bacterium]MBT6134157.1 hypothetical protein [Kordiimonadaceae bacterium]MBT6467538.1 hypothetical protein [Kordiimonadaceae bacterium]